MNVSDLALASRRIGDDRGALSATRAIVGVLARDARARDRGRYLPYEEIAELAREGITAITVPRAYGGADVSAVTLSQVLMLLAEADANIGQIPQSHFATMEVLRICATPEQQDFYYRRVMAGDVFGNALSEADGRPGTEFATTLLPDGTGSFVLNGRKFYSTGTLFAQWIAVFAKDEDCLPVVSLLHRTTPGITVIDDWSGIGQRTTGSGTTIFENVRVQASQVIAHHRAFQPGGRLGSFKQLLHAAIDCGIARAALADTLALVRARAVPGASGQIVPADGHLLDVAAVGELVLRQHAAEAMVARAARTVDAAAHGSEPAAVAASIAVAEARVATNDAALGATNALFDLGGDSATLMEEGLDRHWRNARTHTVHDPVRWKYHAIGNYWLNGSPPKRNGTL